MQLCKIAGEPPAVAIWDINIKGTVNGIELARQLKEMYGCEIIFLTALSDTKILQAAFAADPVMYVVKPYTDKQLLVAMQMAFHKLFKKEKSVAQKNWISLKEKKKLQAWWHRVILPNR